VSYQIEQVHALSAPDFRRLLGVKRETFEAMLAALTRREAAKKKKGRPPDLTLEQQLLLALQFWREYRTHYHLAAEWQVAENTVRRTIQRVENALVKSGAFSLPGRRKVGGVEPQWQVLVVDVTESPIERPKKSNAPATRARRSATR
jgi:hypothetical protein